MLSKIKRIAKNRVVWDKGSTQRSVAGDLYDTVCDALEDALEIIAKLERVALAASVVNKDAFWSEEGGPHFLVDAEYIKALDDALEDAKHLLEKS